MVLAFALAGADASRAQLVVNATVESQYRYQGVDLSNGEPDGRIGLSYDHPSGAYGGASLIVGNTVGVGVQPLGYLGYLGFARQTAQGITWDVGLTNSDITLHLPATRSVYSDQTGRVVTHYTRSYSFDYTQIYAGLSRRDLSARLYLSPNYLGQGLTTAYLDLNEAVRPVDRLRLFLHAGALTPLGGSAGSNLDREHFDIGPGAAWEFRHGEIQLSWAAAGPQVYYPVGYPQKRQVFVLSVTGFF